MARINISLSDKLYADIKVISDAEEISMSAACRMILADAAPKMAQVVRQATTASPASPGDVQSAEAWLADLNRVMESAPPPLRQMLGGLFQGRPGPAK